MGIYGIEELIFHLRNLLLGVCMLLLCVEQVDEFFKRKKYKMINKKWFMLRTKKVCSEKISIVAFFLQIFNYIFVLVYIIIAVIDSFFFSCVIQKRILLYSSIVYIAFFLINTLIFSFLCGSAEWDENEEKYQMAIDLYNSGEYVQAEIIFTSLGYHKKSKEFATKCKNAIDGMFWDSDLSLFNNGNCDESNDSFLESNIVIKDDQEKE